MESWKVTALILCGFGLFKEFRPSEPFFTEYLMDYKGISQEDIVHVAFPVWTYTYLGTLFLVFLVTDYLRYRSVIILEGLAYVATWILITWGQGLVSLIIVEIFYGIACSTEVAYYTYIYAKVDRKHYKKVTSCTYSAIFAGRFFGGLCAQLLVSFNLMNYHELNYVSLGCVSLAFIFSLCLPSVKQSIYFHRDEVSGTSDNNYNDIDHANVNIDGPQPTVTIKGSSMSSKIKRTGQFLYRDFKDAYSSGYVLKWSLWWSVATAGHLQVINYIQALWETIVNSSGSNVDGQIYNGAVEAIHTLLSSILAFGVGHVSISWTTWGESFLAVVSLAQGVLLYLTSRTDDLYVAYAAYIAYRMLYQVVITIASAEVAERIREDSYALIFGINTFMALVIQTILTVVVTDDVGLSLDERTQYIVYGGYHGALGAFFVVAVIFSLLKKTSYHLKDDK